MSAAEYDQQCTEAACKTHIVKFVGGSAAVTKVYGKGITVSYISTGIVEFTWSDITMVPGTFLGPGGHTFQATTQANVKNYVAVVGAYNTTTRKLRVHLFESGTLTDLDASEWLTLTLYFKEEAV